MINCKKMNLKMIGLLIMVLFVWGSCASSNINNPSAAGAGAGAGALKVGFYKHSCPLAEGIVQKYVKQFVSYNPGIGAGLIRLHFHDCFVRGCDGSVLLDGPNSEKESIPNKGSLRGFEVIDAAKAELERRCPATVSCADILAFAARDSANQLGAIDYAVPSGRRDGRVALIGEPLQHLPPPFFNATSLRDNFARKGLSLDDMVTLSGAHSIGISHCSSFSSRLYPTRDPTMDPKFAAFLASVCPSNTTVRNPVVALDSITPKALDNKFYVGLKASRGLLTTDQVLMTSPLTSKMVEDNAQYGDVWANKFAAAMVRMGSIEVLTGRKGEIRKKCRFVN